LIEDVVGLGEYGKTLTILWAGPLPDPEEEEQREQEENDDENLPPSQRW
jgi:hypothetical protein